MRKFSDAHRRKLSKAAKGKLHPWQEGKHLSKETKEKISIALAGRPLSEETKKKMSKVRKGKSCPKISEANKGNKRGSIHGLSYTKEYIRFHRKLYKCRKKQAEGTHTLGEWETLMAQYGCTCPACGKSEPEISLTEDHIIPLSKGGSNFIENIQPLCSSCNKRKQTKIIAYLPIKVEAQETLREENL